MNSKLDKIMKRVYGSKKTKRSTADGQKKVNFPWLKKPYSRKAKAYLCFIIDQKGYSQLGSKKKKELFDSEIYDKVVERFPNLYDLISHYYMERGKQLSKSHFRELLYARMCSIYLSDLSIRTKEHPTQSINAKYRDDYQGFLND